MAPPYYIRTKAEPGAVMDFLRKKSGENNLLKN